MILFITIYSLGFLVSYYTNRYYIKTHMGGKYTWKDFGENVALSLLFWHIYLLFILSHEILFLRVINKIKFPKFPKSPPKWL